MKQILIKPIITEKSMAEVSSGKYCFTISKNANKHQVIKAVKDLYNVDATTVNIINIKGEKKRLKDQKKASTKASKKAIVTLKKGQKIEGFEVKG